MSTTEATLAPEARAPQSARTAQNGTSHHGSSHNGTSHNGSSQHAAAQTRTERRWVDVCAYADIIPERGVCAMVGGTQVAVFRTFDGDLYALSNLDPFSGAHVLSRGILGTRDGVPTVASPMYKQVFDLRTGVCLDDPRVALPAYGVRRAGGRVEVAVPDEHRR
ncbi:nitrite reductase small subunit NirD [Actinomadura sp. WAC 06369]|uniref:nitrite reductase small subunit NirD n=1 Tax=Actinomadura sp. WAC 06369 TaxID=2203193 RepID=UPI000F76AD52|nr:nitrite reductase small subunit NirD [Actinomadura sp. WAC 06369]RSN69355.1 nitrite reductase (NAD(P)H) small subunit [Actinomadura sp. WAC 06369]